MIDKAPSLLKAFLGFATSLPHPAAVFWDDNFILLFNEAWGGMHGDAMQQGQSQAQRLDKKACDALSFSMKKRVAVNVDANSLLLDHAPEGSKLLVSPIVDFERNRSGGVLAQLLPYLGDDNPRTGKSSMLETRRSGSPAGGNAISANVFRTTLNFANLPEQNEEGDGAVDDLPLNEHPFFRRIAAMLPTGIAILNHKAEAVFVNEQFYELTTHVDTDKSFRSWPNTIHPEHYDRVMKAYQDAFDMQQPLRTEFKAQGQGEKWRLLLLTPIGDGNLRHASLREQGGFICAIVDITTNKIAELSERKAAREAQERKEQQERFIDMISHEIRECTLVRCREISGTNYLF
jgi:PAS domain-containing protein